MSTNFLGGGVVLDEDGRPLDQIVLTGIGATGYHGVFEHERREGQTFTADVVVHLDTRRAAAADDLARTVNYGALAEAVAGVLAGEPADLIETVAERIAATALADPTVAAVDVAVHKPQAPITVPFEDVVVRVHRDRHKLPAAEPWRPADVQAAQRRAAEQPAQRPAERPREASPDGPRPAPAPTPVPVAQTAPAGAALSAADAAAPGGSASHPTPAVERPDRLDEAPPGPVEAVLALGGNLGSAQTTLREAVADIERIAGVEIVAVSPLARTAAVGGPSQPDFLNAVVIVRTTLSPRALLHAAQAIEQQHGRERLERWGPRTLDVDLITYGSTLAVTDDLELPHPRAHERAFVLQPWAQVAPDAVLPGLGGGPVAALAATAPDRDGVRWLALDWMTAAVPSGSREHEAAPDAPAPVPVPQPVDVHSTAAPDESVGDDPAWDAHDADGSHEPDGAAAADGAERVDDAADEDGPEPEAPPAPQDPLDWLPALPPSGGAGTAEPRTPGVRAGVFSPVVAPDDVPHPGDRQS